MVRIVGLDPSLRNWGMVNALYDQEHKKLLVQSVEIIQPDLSMVGSSKQNLLDIESATQLYAGTFALIRDADFVIAEIPTGSQSSRASLGSGVCLGVLGALKLIPLLNFIPVSPTEVKRAGHGTLNATKKEMIEWAVTKHPEANWPRYKSKGELVINEGKAEHMCDALAAIYAGLKKLKM
jgi:hypothetical protein